MRFFSQSPLFPQVPPARRVMFPSLIQQGEKMRVRVAHKADAVYLNLTGYEIAESEEVADGIVVDYDAEGRIAGLEILDVSRRTGDPAVLKQCGLEFPSATYAVAPTSREVQSLKGMLRGPDKPVGIEEMKCGVGRKKGSERPRR